MVENPKYQPLMEALGREIDKGAAMICIWDFDHGSPEPRAVYTDDALLKIASRHGKPLYAVELPGAENFIPAYLAGDAAKAQAADAELTRRGAAPYIPLMHDMREGKMLLVSPDPRAASFNAFLKGLSDADKKLYIGLIEAVQHGHAGKTAEQALQDYMQTLTPEQVKAVNSHAVEFARAWGVDPTGLDTTAVDQMIAGNIKEARAHLDAKGHTTVMLYGAAHFTKSTPDLDELSVSPGERSVSVAVVAQPATQTAKMVYSDGHHNDLPDYAWYSEQSRLVKLDTNSAKGEFLDIAPEQVPMFEKTGVYPQKSLPIGAATTQRLPDVATAPQRVPGR